MRAVQKEFVLMIISGSMTICKDQYSFLTDKPLMNRILAIRYWRLA